jgi:GT2 family glycosyltransferase
MIDQQEATGSGSGARRVLVSILNWNAARKTLRCVESLVLQNTDNLDVKLSVIDNGSRPGESEILLNGLADTGVALSFQEKNLGFAGGHNLSIRSAIEGDLEFAWLVNNDATVHPDALVNMIRLMDADPQCGAVSPVSIAEHDHSRVDFIGAKHDWANLTSIRLHSQSEVISEESRHAKDMWISGAAVLFRMKAIKQIGMLDENLFAYFEDNDISARLSAAGWKNRMAFDAKIVHACHDGDDTNRPPYFFYLMQRNAFRFWRKNTPSQFRRSMTVRLLDRSLYEVNKLYHQGHYALGQAALLGTSDGLFGRSGPPVLNRSPSKIVALLRIVFNFQHRRALQRLDAANTPQSGPTI